MKIERHKIMSREQWLALRRRDWTASVAAALLGVHPYETTLSVWMEKKGLADDNQETEAMERGTLLEPVAVELLKRRCPTWRIERNRTYYRAPAFRLGATPDVRAVDPERPGRGIVQIKTVEPFIFRETWQGGDWKALPTPPDWIAIQAIIEAKLSGAQWCDVFAMRIGHAIKADLIPIPLHDKLFDRITDEALKFWDKFQDGSPPKADYSRDAEALSRLYAKDSGETIDLSNDNRFAALAAELEEARARGKKATEDEKAIRAELLEKLGSAAQATGKDGLIVTAKTVERPAYVAKASTHRQLKVKRPKETSNGKTDS